jgi:hypothetical protein
MKRARRGVARVLPFAAAAVFLICCAGKDTRNETVGTVNGDEIKVFELREFMGFGGSTPLGGGTSAERKKEALERFISGQLLAQDARKRGLDNTPEYRQAIEQNEESVWISALFRKEMDAKFAVEDKDVKEEAGRLRAADNTLSEKDAGARATQAVAERSRKKVEEGLIAAAKKETGAVIRQEVLQEIAGGKSIPDNAVLATIGTDTIRYAEVKRRLSGGGGGAHGGRELAKNPMAIAQYLERELTGRSLLVLARKQGIEGSGWLKTTRKDLERSVLIRSLMENVVFKGLDVGDKEVETAYREHARMFVREGKKVPLPEVRGQLRSYLMEAKRRKAAESYVEELKKKAKISVNEAVLPKV